MRGIADESALPVIGFVEPDERIVVTLQEVIEGTAQFIELVARTGRRQALSKISRCHRCRRPGHSIHWRSARRQSQCPAAAAVNQMMPESTASVTPSQLKVASTGAGRRPTTTASTGYCFS